MQEKTYFKLTFIICCAPFFSCHTMQTETIDNLKNQILTEIETPNTMVILNINNTLFCQNPLIQTLSKNLDVMLTQRKINDTQRLITKNLIHQTINPISTDNSINTILSLLRDAAIPTILFLKSEITASAFCEESCITTMANPLLQHIAICNINTQYLLPNLKEDIFYLCTKKLYLETTRKIFDTKTSLHDLLKQKHNYLFFFNKGILFIPENTDSTIAIKLFIQDYKRQTKFIPNKLLFINSTDQKDLKFDEITRYLQRTIKKRKPIEIKNININLYPHEEIVQEQSSTTVEIVNHFLEEATRRIPKRSLRKNSIRKSFSCELP